MPHRFLFQELLGASRVVASGSLGQGAKAAKDTVKDKVEDVQEAWETSQVTGYCLTVFGVSL